MEGKRDGTDGVAVDEDDIEVDSADQYHDFIVDGEFYQALDLGRRLLQLEDDYVRRADAAQLLLERLRSNHDDSSDHANALLRVLANYATPTKELTEELLSLLFFCEHRVQIIHHLSKLTFQSRDCVSLVVDAYIELLSSDRSLLVPILGSLADMPLVAADKAHVIDTTESLLDAASEEDVPAVVQSLFSMLVPAAAHRIVTKIRAQCNRLVTTNTLSITFDVVMRHAVAGSGVLTALLRVIRQSDGLTPFDVIFLALLLARPSENAAAVRVVSSLAARGALNPQIVQDTLQCLRDQKWQGAFPCCVRLASALISSCFNAYYSAGVAATVQCAIEILGYLVVYRTPAQEEALSLLMSMVSQPQRLVFSTSKKRFMATAQRLCWHVAYTVAAQLDNIAKAHPTALAPFAHIFLDHLYGIAATFNQSVSQGSTTRIISSYPAVILESLCRTMVMLTKHEPGMVSLLMITIQKQLVVPIGGSPAGITTVAHTQASIVVQVKQLMAVFLAGEMLLQGVGERSDRSSLLSWIQKLLASAAVSDETTSHVIRLLSTSTITNILPPADREATSKLLSTVFSRLGFEVTKHSSVASRHHSTPPQLSVVEFLPGLSEQSSSWTAASLVFDVVTYVRVSRLGEPPIGWKSLVGLDSPAGTIRSAEKNIRAKIDLLPVLIKAFVDAQASSSIDSDVCDRALVCSFALPSITEDTFDERLPTTLWCYACALQLAVMTANSLAIKQQLRTMDPKLHSKNMSETMRQRKRLLHRVQASWTLYKRLRALLDEVSTRLKEPSNDRDPGRRDVTSSTWLKLQVDIIEKKLDWEDFPVAASATSAYLCSLGQRLSLQVVSAVFEGLWKHHTSTIESGLEIELFRAFPARLLLDGIDEEAGSDIIPVFGSMQALVNTQDGRRTIKYLARRLLDYCELLASLSDDSDGDETSDADSDSHNTHHWVLMGVHTLCKALRSIIDVCRKQRQQRAMSVGGEDDDLWEETTMELFAKGANDVRIRQPAGKRTNSVGWATNCEIVYRSLSKMLVQSKHGEVACELMDVLLSLTCHTRTTNHLSQISLALLHCPFPATQAHSAGSTLRVIRRTPIMDPVVSAAMTNLLRPMPQKFHHLVYLNIGAWTIPSTHRVALRHVSHVVDCMEALISTTASNNGHAVGANVQRGQQRSPKRTHNTEPDAEGDIENWIAHGGEHRVLRNLTLDSLPAFLEASLAWLTSAPLRAIPTSMTEHQCGDASPFFDLIATLAIMSRCFHIFATAEVNGLNLPQRVSLTILRCGPVFARNVEQALTMCISWREEGADAKAHKAAKDVEHLQGLFEAADGVLKTAEEVASSFQERVVVTMQKNAHAPGTSKESADGSKRSDSGRWSSELLRKTYRSQFRRRRPLSKREAKLLPYFTHSAERLKAYIAEIGITYRFELTTDQAAQLLSRSLSAIRMTESQLEAVLALLDPSDEGVDLAAFSDVEDVENRWRTFNPAEDVEAAVNDDFEDEEDDDDDEVWTEDEYTVLSARENKHARIKKYSKPGTKRTNGGVHTLVPQRKRVKVKGTAQR